jgi:hypothetical protein
MFKKIYINIIVALLLSPAVLRPLFAAESGEGIDNPLGNATPSLSALFEAVTKVAVQLGTVVAGLAIMYGGYLYVTANGNEEKLQQAQKTITWAMVGTAVLLGSTVIFKAIEGTIRGLK